MASLSQGRTAAAQCGLFTYKSVPVILDHLVYTDHQNATNSTVHFVQVSTVHSFEGNNDYHYKLLSASSKQLLTFISLQPKHAGI